MPHPRYRAMLYAAFAWFHDVDARFSTYRADSEVCRLDRGEVRRADATAGLRTVLDACEKLRATTVGYVDA